MPPKRRDMQGFFGHWKKLWKAEEHALPGMMKHRLPRVAVANHEVLLIFHLTKRLTYFANAGLSGDGVAVHQVLRCQEGLFHQQNGPIYILLHRLKGLNKQILFKII